jgi:hypothetical protein
MAEIVLLILATGGIAAFARGRGGKPWLWGTLTVVGYFLVPFLVTLLAVFAGFADPRSVQENKYVWFYASAIAWVAILAFCARFLLGRNYAKPDGMWACKNCHYLNKQYAVICEACREPYASKAPPFS